jgi:hypothetical protein
VWCTERQGRVIDFWITFSEMVSSYVGSSDGAGLTTAGRADLPPTVAYSQSLENQPLHSFFLDDLLQRETAAPQLGLDGGEARERGFAEPVALDLGGDRRACLVYGGYGALQQDEVAFVHAADTTRRARASRRSSSRLRKRRGFRWRRRDPRRTSFACFGPFFDHVSGI